MLRSNPLGKNIARILLIAVVCGGIAAAILWATLPMWAPPLLRQPLQQRGWQLAATTLQRPGWRTLAIDQLTLQQHQEARTITLRASGVVLHYQWRELLHGRLQRVDIAHLRAEIVPATTTQPAGAPLSLSSVLPSELFAQLPLDALHIGAIELQTPWPRLALLHGSLDYREQTVALQLQNSEPQPLTLQLHADRTNQIDLQLRDATRELIALRHRFIDQRTTATTAAQPTAIEGRAALDLDALQAWVPSDAARLSGKLQANWRGQVPDVVDANWPQQLTLNGEIDGTGSIATDTLPHVQTDIAGQFQFAAGILSGSVARGNFDLQLPIPAAVAKLYDLRAGENISVAVVVDPATRYQLNLAEKTITLKPVRIDARLRNKTAGIDSTLTVDTLSAQYGATLAVDAHASITTPELPLSTFRLRPAHLSATLKYADEQLGARWQVNDVAKLYRADGTLRYQPTAGSGEVNARLQPLTFRENGSYLPALFAHWPWPLDFTGGQLQLQGLLRWNTAGTHASAVVETSQLGGFYNRNLFRGVDAKLNVDYRSYTRNGHDKLQVRSQPISIAEIQSGVPIHNIGGTLLVDNTVVQLQNFRAEVFAGHVLGGMPAGGSVNGDTGSDDTVSGDNKQPATMRYVIGAEQNQLALQLSGLQLPEILALQEGVAGTGVIDGTIPLLLHKDGIRVDSAQFQARAPGGILRYHGAAGAGAPQNPGLALAFKALENFHYDTMTMRADFALGKAYGDQSGDLLLAVALKGRNPTAIDTPPVNFNLNVRENIPDLLQTLQIGENISDRIEQRIKKLQQTPRTQPSSSVKKTGSDNDTLNNNDNRKKDGRATP
jgi:hypothetical protein